MLASNWVRVVAVVVVVGGEPACLDIPVVPPANATLELTPTKDTVKSTADSIVLSAAITLETGDPLGYDASVTFATNLGGLCETSSKAARCGIDSATGLPRLTVKTRHGVAVAVLIGQGRVGLATVRARSGDAQDSTTATVIP